MNKRTTLGKKTLSFALVHFTVAFSVGWLITGSAVLGGLLACVEPLINTLAYAVHEHLWQRKSTIDTLSAMASVGT